MLVSLFLFLASSRGISIEDPEGSLPHDSYYVFMSWGHRLVLLLPLLAGVVLVFTGLHFRVFAKALVSELGSMEEVGSPGSGELD